MNVRHWHTSKEKGSLPAVQHYSAADFELLSKIIRSAEVYPERLFLEADSNEVREICYRRKKRNISDLQHKALH